VNKDIIRRNFSRYAHLYDDHALVQKHAAGKLAGRAGKNGISSILEIGCGTGNYTAMLHGKFTGANIMALDISDRMLEMARKKIPGSRVEFISCDAETADVAGRYDLVTSNASMQWFEDLGLAARKYRSALNEKGKFLFSVFGPRTFRELNAVFEKVLAKKDIVPAGGFLSGEEISKTLDPSFRGVSVEEEMLEEEYPSLRALLESIKYTGERGARGAGYIGPGRMKEAEELYRETFGGIKATYQIFYCRGEK
jgi:malonyl-CoA O-methyltransferase